MKAKRKGLLIVVSAASGAGKSTLCRMLMKRWKNLSFSISATTRQPRPGEKDGRDYYFLSEAAFKAMVKRKEFVEWANVHGQLYGTPKAALERMLEQGKDVLLDLDVQGAMAVKKQFKDAVLIFIKTPTFADLEKRLRSRSSETEAQIQRRLQTARKELKWTHRYDHQVLNDRLPTALKQLVDILKLHRDSSR